MQVIEYPQELPDQTIQRLLALFRNPDVDALKAEARFLWHIQGSAMSMFLPSSGGFSAAADSKSAEECAQELEKMQAAGLGSNKAVPWNLLLPIVIALLKKLLGI